MVAAGEPGETSGTSAHPRPQLGVSLVVVLDCLRVLILLLDQSSVQVHLLVLVFLPQWSHDLYIATVGISPQ